MQNMSFTTRPYYFWSYVYDIGTRTPLVQEITTRISDKVNDYILASSKRSERERMVM
jgi:leucyl-tRNA synthetase